MVAILCKKKSILFVKSQRSFFVKKIMANKQIDMRKVKHIFKLYSEGVSKRQISSRLGISRNTNRLTNYEVSEMTLEELHKLFKPNRKPKSQQLLTLEKCFPYFDKELRKMINTPTGSNYLSSGIGIMSGAKKYLP